MNANTENKLRIFIVDDESPSRLRMKNLLDDLAPQFPLEVVGEASDGFEALEKIIQLPVDVVLADIRMPRMDGLELALHLMGIERSPAIIFTTAYDQHALKAFELEALDYLVKPIRIERLADSLRRARPNSLSIQTLRALCPQGRTQLRCIEGNRVLLVPVNEVIFFQSDGGYTAARTWERTYVIDDTLNQLEEEFPAAFIRLRRNYLANREAIIGFVREKGDGLNNSWLVKFRGIPDELKVGRRQWPEVKESFKHKFGEIK